MRQNAESVEETVFSELPDIAVSLFPCMAYTDIPAPGIIVISAAKRGNKLIKNGKNILFFIRISRE